MKKTTQISIVRSIVLVIVVIIATVAMMLLLVPKEPLFAWTMGLIIITMAVFFGVLFCFHDLKQDAREAERKK
jgi:Na+/melibiose symporter-like transporter